MADARLCPCGKPAEHVNADPDSQDWACRIPERPAPAERLWVLVGNLDDLEYAIADYIYRYGQHLPGVNSDTIAGTPVAAANMAMTVIRKNVRRVTIGE